MSEDQEAMDLCECVFSHEFAMRRLLNLVSLVEKLENSREFASSFYRDQSRFSTNVL